MGALENSKTWIPYMKSKECTQQVCSLSCPQWCYIIFPPPPPFAFPEDYSQKGITFSPLVIAIIGILASAFLLVSYYAIISKYCGNSEASRRRENRPRNEELEEEGSNNNDHDHEFTQHEPWFVSTNGLDEALIKNITLVKYKKEDGLIGSTDCSVCLGEFLEDDTLRLLPKCSHAFHVACIDAWLKSHSNCPLCRANIVSVSVSVKPVLHPPPILVVDDHTNDINVNHTQDQLSSSQNCVENEEISSSEEGSGRSHKNPFRTFSDLAGLGLRQSSHVTSLTHHEGENVVRRSFSMDHSHEMSVSVSISDMLRLSHGEDCQVENCQAHDQTLKMGVAESSKSGFRTSSSNNSRYGGLFGVVNSVGLKRSFSSGRFLFSKHGRASNAVIPV